MLAIRTIICASALFTTAAFFGVAACSSDEHAHPDDEEHLDYCDLPEVCKEIVDICHQKDNGEDPESEVHKCHETAHDEGTQAGCEAVHDDCIATCEAAPALGEPEPPMSCEDGGGHTH